MHSECQLQSANWPLGWWQNCCKRPSFQAAIPIKRFWYFYLAIGPSTNRKHWCDVCEATWLLRVVRRGCSWQGRSVVCNSILWRSGGSSFLNANLENNFIFWISDVSTIILSFSKHEIVILRKITSFLNKFNNSLLTIYVPVHLYLNR